MAFAHHDPKKLDEVLPMDTLSSRAFAEKEGFVQDSWWTPDA